MDRGDPLCAMMAVESLFCLLHDAAVRHGARTAIDFDGHKVSYQELIDAADRLAGLLASHGAAPGHRVAFCFRKSIEALVSLFAIIRTGAAYVPIDPTWPEDRVVAICEDAEIRLWTGTQGPPSAVKYIKATFVSNVTDVAGAVALASYQQHLPMAGPPRAPADGIANILFTSGSTGRPKGVLITTISLLHFSKWVVEYFGLNENDRLANHAPYNFDLSTLDIFAAIRAGATMCPVPEKTKMFPYQTAKFIADQRITTWYSVPSALIMMQQRGKLAEHDFSALKHVIFAGEVMPKPALQALSQEIPHATLTNLYGPTETNVCTYYRVDAAELASDAPVPIGFPLNDTPIWIVDEQDRPVAEGESGQLLVAGPLVTAGYCGDAELTAAKLMTAPDGKGRAYRTGDRVRRRDDGALLFEGRMDRMIKCRGHRIEPGEIEAALHKHPSVKEAAVVPMPDPVFGNRIRACLASKEGQRLDESTLASHCREHLPSYMMPDEWRFLETLPRTDRGKVDLQSLINDKRP